MTRKIVGILGTLLLCQLIPVGCDSQIAQKAMRWGMDKALEDCYQQPQGRDLPREECGESSLGQGLVCPNNTERDGESARCDFQYETKLLVNYPVRDGIGGKVRINVTTRTRNRRELVHTHECETPESGSCAPSYVNERVTIDQDAEVKVETSLLWFLRWETVARKTRSSEVCGREDHPEPLECGPVEDPS